MLSDVLAQPVGIGTISMISAAVIASRERPISWIFASYRMTEPVQDHVRAVASCDVGDSGIMIERAETSFCPLLVSEMYYPFFN